MQGTYIDIPALLAARDQRAKRQRILSRQYASPLICFTMNIPGGVKTNDLIELGFRLGCRMVEDQLAAEGIRLLHREQHCLPTGCEGYYAVDAPVERVKQLMAELEDSRPVARLFDLDVLDKACTPIDRGSLGFAPRQCLLCRQPAKLCGRSRAHGLAALTERVESLLTDAAREEYSKHWGQLAAKALLYEVCTTPKPGLVDRSNAGSHRDMNIFTFLSSTAALQPYFSHCAKIGLETACLPPAETFRRLRLIGKEAEREMYRATGGINTHKGAIFTIGLLCGSAGRLGWCAPPRPADILSQCAKMAAGLSAELGRENACPTQGQFLYARYGVTGIRGQAASGFPAVSQAGLPTLKKALAAGHTLEESGCAALLSIMRVCQDTNLLSRGGSAGSRYALEQAEAVLAHTICPAKETLESLDRDFIQKNLSPGGSADLLAATYFLHFAETTPAPL